MNLTWQPGFRAVAGGTVTATNPANTVTTATGGGLVLQGMTIGAGNLVFASVNTGTAGGGPVNGISIDTVTGGSITINGAANVTKATGDSILLNNVSSAFKINGTTTSRRQLATLWASILRRMGAVTFANVNINDAAGSDSVFRARNITTRRALIDNTASATQSAMEINGPTGGIAFGKTTADVNNASAGASGPERARR